MVPVTVACALFSQDIILVILGPNGRTRQTFSALIAAVLAFMLSTIWLAHMRGQMRGASELR